MPYVKELVRKRRKPRITIEKAYKAVQVMLVITLFSLMFGWFSVLISNYLSDASKPLKGFSSGKNAGMAGYKDKIMGDYKTKYGTDWKNKLMTDYGSYMK